jgi:hypothetical protein
VTNGFGKLKITGIPASSSRLFPVAPFVLNSYDPLTITSTAGAVTNDYSVRVERGVKPGVIYDLTKVINRTWTINSTTGINSNTVGLTYQYSDSAKNSNCSPTLPMEEGHFAGGVWNIDPVASLLTPSGSNPYTVGPFYPNTLDSSFVIGNQASILAMKITIQLTAIKNNLPAALEWKTQGAVIVKNYFIERSSDGLHFITVSPSLTSNKFTDGQWPAGINYFRVKMTDIDGRTYYSNTVVLLNAAAGEALIKISPNPVVSGRFKLIIIAAADQKIKLQIRDMQGRVVKKQMLQAVNGLTVIEIDVQHLAPGTYCIFNEAEMLNKKALVFIKK